MFTFTVALAGLLVGLSLAPAAPATTRDQAPSSEPRPYPIWRAEPVAPGEPPLDLALDADGNPHLVSHPVAPDRLQYSVKRGGEWQSVDVAPLASAVDLSVVIALDPAGVPSIAYTDEQQADTFVATQVAGGWLFDRVTDYGRLVQFEIGPDGRPYLVLVQGQQVMAWTREGGEWSGVPVGTPDYFDPYVWNLWLALGPDGRPHVAYTGGGGSTYAVLKDDGTWDAHSIPLSNIEGLDVSEAGEPLFLITEARSEPGHPPLTVVTLLLAEEQEGEWVTTVLDEGINWGADARIAAHGETLIVAYHDAVGRLFVRERTADLWRAAMPSDYGTGIALAVGPDGQPCVAEAANGQLRLLTRSLISVDHDVYLGLVAR